MCATVNALYVEVYRSKDYFNPDEDSDCTNGGISSKYNYLYVVCPNGPDLIDEDDPRLIKIVKRTFGSRVVFHAEPYKECPSGCVGWMAGGNYVATCDSRFGELVEGMYGAVNLHDRCESYELYRSLSD